MLTLPTSDLTVTAPVDRSGYRPYAAHVVGVRQLSPHFVRVTFGGHELHGWVAGGLDQRIKILFPFEGGRFGDLGRGAADADAGSTWHERWRALAPGDRNPFRTFTVRAARPGCGEIDIDFVDHAGRGPAARWLAAVRPGDPVVLIGPAGPAATATAAATAATATAAAAGGGQRPGIDWRPGEATHALLVGDETAVPAACAILESLPAGSAVTALLEVPSTDDVLPVRVGEQVTITWLPRGSAPVGDPLDVAVRDWLAAHPEHWRSARAPAPQPLPAVDVDHETLWEGSDRTADRGFYAWLAGEAAMIRSLRRCLVAEHGIDRRQVAFMGYWRLGRPERQE